VNILAAHQAHVAQHFAVSGGDKFHDLQWQPGRHGAPVIDEVSAYFEAALEHRIPAYTHTIFIGRVLDAAGSERPPLLYLGGKFFDGSAVQPASQPAPTARQGETGRT
jgi:flavin reductase (DIM6/NTAB) family NADH-FMN oxidoreductase RutF